MSTALSTRHPEPLLSADNLRVVIPTTAGRVHATDGVDLSVFSGQTLGVVGETGSGKSVTCRALLGLRPSRAAVVTGVVTHPGLDDRNVLDLDNQQLRRRWGRYVSLIPQNPMTSLNPVRTIGDQVSEAVRATRGLHGQQLRHAVLELMDRVGIPAAARRLGDHPHQYSGGMLQRTLIAIALAGNPRVLVADEPTTALDVLVQDQILSLLVDLQQQTGMGLVLVSHDLAVVAQMSDRVAVMYAGQIVESTSTPELIGNTRHPYAAALLRALPGAVARDKPLQVIPGSPPQLVDLPTTCRFRPRCDRSDAGCDSWQTDLLSVDVPDAATGAGSRHLTRCRRHEQLAHPPPVDASAEPGATRPTSPITGTASTSVPENERTP